MRWYRYEQTNAGGSFTGPAYIVFIQAKNPRYADFVAKEEEILDFSSYCPCCGERWSYADEHYAHDDIESAREYCAEPDRMKWTADSARRSGAMAKFYDQHGSLIETIDAPPEVAVAV